MRWGLMSTAAMPALSPEDGAGGGGSSGAPDAGNKPAGGAGEPKPSGQAGQQQTPPASRGNAAQPEAHEDEDGTDDGVATQRRPLTSYEKKLRKENRELRQNLGKVEESISEKIEAAMRPIREELGTERQKTERAGKDATAAAHAAIRLSTAKSVLGAAGLLDEGFIASAGIDLSGIEVDEHFQPKVPAGWVEKVKGEKPRLFGAKQTTSGQPGPTPDNGKGKDAKAMSAEEWKAERARVFAGGQISR